MVDNIFHSIFMVYRKTQVYTMNFTNAVFMVMKIKITNFSWLFHNFLTKGDFIVCGASFLYIFEVVHLIIKQFLFVSQLHMNYRYYRNSKV